MGHSYHVLWPLLFGNLMLLIECQFQSFFEQLQPPPIPTQSAWTAPWQQPQQQFQQDQQSQQFWQQQQSNSFAPPPFESTNDHRRDQLQLPPPHHHHHVQGNGQFQQNYQQQNRFIQHPTEQISSLDGRDVPVVEDQQRERDFQDELPELYRPPVIFHLPNRQHPQRQEEFGEPRPLMQFQRPKTTEFRHNNQAVLSPFPQLQQQQNRPTSPPHISPPIARPLPNQKIAEVLKSIASTIGTTTKRSSKLRVLTTTRRAISTVTPATVIATRLPPSPLLSKTNTRTNVAGDVFDVPPPPPSRFLPEEEKIRIAEFLSGHQPQQPFRNAVDQDIIRPRLPPLEDDITVPTVTTTIATTTVITTIAGTTSDSTPRSTLARLSLPSAVTPIGKRARNNTRPNQLFLQCCRTKQVPKSCESRCNFDVLNRKILTAMFLNTDKCPSEYGLELFTCAAQDSDHTECCKQKRVQRTAAGDKCLSFCDLSPDAPRVQADASYLPCWAVLNEIKDCFRDKIAASVN